LFALLLAVGYPGLEFWSQRLLNERRIVQKVVDSLAANGTTTPFVPVIRKFAWRQAAFRR